MVACDKCCYTIVSLLFISFVWAAAKPPETVQPPVEFKVLPERSQEFFQVPGQSPEAVERSFPAPPVRNSSPPSLVQGALMFLLGGLSTEVAIDPSASEVNDWGYDGNPAINTLPIGPSKPDEAGNNGSIRQIFDKVFNRDPRQNYHEGRCTRP